MFYQSEEDSLEDKKKIQLYIKETILKLNHIINYKIIIKCILVRKRKNIIIIVAVTN